MGYGIINVWIRNRNCTVAANTAGTVTVTPCCATASLPAVTITAGHCEVKVPPGCYIVKAVLTAPSARTFELMAIVGCDKHACINFVLPG
jgi:hypothetical protein